jgi:hypothetical protein
MNSFDILLWIKIKKKAIMYYIKKYIFSNAYEIYE